MTRVIESSGGGKIIFVARSLYNRPRNTSKDQWLGRRRKKKSLGMVVVRMAPHYVTPTAQQEKIASYGRACGDELRGKLAGKDWATIKKAMAACVMIKAGKTPPKEWKEVYEKLLKE